MTEKEKGIAEAIPFLFEISPCFFIVLEAEKAQWLFIADIPFAVLFITIDVMFAGKPADSCKEVFVRQ